MSQSEVLTKLDAIKKKGKKLYTKQQQSPLTANDCHLEDHETYKDPCAAQVVTAQLSVEVLPSPLNVSSSLLLESQVWLSTMTEHNFATACQPAANRIFGCTRRTEAGY